MSEILISSPQPNMDNARDHLMHADDVQRTIIDSMTRLGITPQRYPRAVDFAAGNGSFAATVLRPMGYQMGNITNIDVAQPNPDESPGSRWLYLDLERLGASLQLKGKLPSEVTAEKGRYDFASIASGFEIMDYIDYLADFFLRKGGVIWTAIGRDRLERPRAGSWKKLQGDLLFEKR